LQIKTGSSLELRLNIQEEEEGRRKRA